MTETLITKEFSMDAMMTANMDESLLTVEQARFLIYCQHNLDECVVEGTMMICTCDNSDCVNPDHTQMIPPTVH